MCYKGNFYMLKISYNYCFNGLTSHSHNEATPKMPPLSEGYSVI